MAKFACVCGTVISTSGNIPNENEWKLLSDVEFDKYSGQIDVEVLYQSATIAFRCPVSDHLWIFWDGFDKHHNSTSRFQAAKEPGYLERLCNQIAVSSIHPAFGAAGFSQQSLRGYRREVRLDTKCGRNCPAGDCNSNKPMEDSDVTPKEYDVVRLINPLPDYDLPTGSKGTVVMEFAKSPGRGARRAYEVEFVDDEGVSLVLATVFQDDLEVVWRYPD
jgi:hypothetical protein